MRQRIMLGRSGALLTLVLCTWSGASGCDECRPPGGDWTALRTRAGIYEGYEIRADCLEAAEAISIRGTGARWYSDVGPASPVRDLALRELAGAAVQHVTESWTGGARRGCSNESAIGLELVSWNDVDSVVASVATLLRTNDLREEVVVEVAKVCGH
jgi:hypothetical protein